MTESSDTAMTSAQHIGKFRNEMLAEHIPAALVDEIVLNHVRNCGCLSDVGAPLVVVAS